MPIIWVEFNAFGIGDTQAADIKVSSKLPDKEVRERLSPVNRSGISLTSLSLIRRELRWAR
jgi:hypothetical protein